jgi:ubiquitin carboxyl-terminal hydrolase 8
MLVKPNFPFTSSITPDTLRSYFMNAAVDVLIVDVRPSEEFQKGFVGTEYVERGCKVNVVWIDPTVLMRPGLTSTQLENALSISPEAQQMAFASRNQYDLVVIVDSRSKMFPGKGEGQTAAGNLRAVIYEHEFAKTLPRSPALLLGGYEGWIDFIKARGRINMQRFQQEHGHQPSPVVNGPPNGPPNGHSNPLSPRQTNAPPPIPDRRHAREKSYQTSPSHYSKEITENFSHGSPQSMTSSRHQHNYSASYSAGPASYMPYQQAPAPVARPQMPRATHGSSNSISSNYGAVQGYTVPSHNRTDSFSNYSVQTGIAPPPRASVHTSAMTRRQSSTDYMDYGSPRQQPRIEYPQAHGLVRVPQPPPAAASHGLERQDQRAPMRLPQRVENLNETGVRYWRDTKLGLTGLKNLGNTCYMNSTVQCLSATFPFARYFLDGAYKRDLNETSNLGTKGRMAKAFADLLTALWGEDWQCLSPITFRQSIVSFNDLFAGNQQHDSQEFLSFVLDGLHEDLNRVKQKPQIEMTPQREKALETLPPQIASDKEWALYRQRDDSFIVDLFQGQYMSRTTCLTCRKVSFALALAEASSVTCANARPLRCTTRSCGSHSTCPLRRAGSCSPNSSTVGCAPRHSVSRMAGEWTFSGILDQKGCGGQAPTLSCRGKSRAWDLQRHHHKAGWPTLRKRRYWSSP